MLQAGFGKADMTPPLGTELAGYGYYLQRRCQRVDDPLFARALALSAEAGPCFLICCDCLGLSMAVANQVKESLQKEYGVQKEHVTMVSIHTHTGPAIKRHEGCGEVNEEYVKTLPGIILNACRAAMGDLSPVSALHFIMNPLDTPIAYNRAFAQNPVDGMARFFKIERMEKRPLILASYACHAVCRGVSPNVSADYPGQICQRIEKMGADGLYLNGLCGDIDPIRCQEGEREKRLSDFADTVLSALHGEGEALPLSLACGAVEETLFLRSLTREQLHALSDEANRQETVPPGGGRVARAWERELMEKAWPLPTQETFSSHYLCLGGVPIVALPFEGYTQTGVIIRRILSDERALCLGCQEEMLGYLPTMDDYDRRSYAAQDAFFLYRRVPTLRGEAERIGNAIGEKLKARLKKEAAV